ncbi:MAG: protein translocase subunit SecDF [Bacteroidales bacterium]|jgi:SecD/SecF fusion protein|nr:protein translocase subunit SecDF [Bacteroidales bacterium]
MRNKGFILFFAITFAVVCLYTLSFTLVTRVVEKNAKEYAQNDPGKQALIERAGDNAFLRTYLLDSANKARENQYLSMMSDSVVYNLLVAKWTYRECKELEINLGLDLKGGMNVMMEVSVPDIIRSLAGNGAKDSLFVKAMELAIERQKHSQTDFVTLFAGAFKEIAPANAKLSTIFRSNKLTLPQGDPTNDDVVKALREEANAALDNTFRVLRTRIDRFGVAQPNIQQLANTGRIMIELPGVKEPERVRKLLQGTAQLEFWKTYDMGDIQKALDDVNTRLAELKIFTTDSTQKEDATALEGDTTALAANDTAKVGLSGADTIARDESLMTEEEIRAKYPLWSVLQVGQREAMSNGKYGALVGYVHEKDTAEVNRIFAMDIVKNMLPADLRLAWHAQTGKEKTAFHQLVALKAVGEQGAVLDGKVITDASQDFTQQGGNEISMSMNQEGAKQWSKITEESKGSQIAIVLDNIVYSYPMVNDKIPNGRSSITGQFSLEEAKDLANLLKAGKLAAPAVIVSEEIVGPTLGQESIRLSMISFALAFCLVLLYMIFFYNRGGIVACIALITNVLFIFGTLASLGAVLTLPGIAGIVLTLGMAVDANVIIFERIKEELRSGKALRLAIADGYKASYSAIIDGNLTTIITGIILYVFGSGPVQGFATTLIIGILTSMFTAIFISRIIFTTVLDKGKTIRFSSKLNDNWLSHTHIDFLSKRKIFYIISCCIVVLSGISLAVKGLDLGIDFAGGRSYTVRFDHSVKPDELRASLTDAFDGIAPEVKTFGSDNQMKITTKWRVSEDNSQVDSLAEVKMYEGLKPFFNTEVSQTDFSVQNQSVGLISSQKVGATVSRDITIGAIMSVLFSLLAIFAYIAIRFRKWQYGLGSLAALAHVTIFTIGMYSIFSGLLPFTMEVDQSFIAAILTIIGYSINDGVVIFDRIRENRVLYPKRDLLLNMNSALNSTLGRTINTTGTTLIVLIAIFIFGGEVIRGFVFSLLCGIAVGSYSSIFIGTSLIYDLSQKADAKRLKEVKK